MTSIVPYDLPLGGISIYGGTSGGFRYQVSGNRSLAEACCLCLAYLAPAAVTGVGSGKVSILSQFTTGSWFSFTMQTS